MARISRFRLTQQKNDGGKLVDEGRNSKSKALFNENQSKKAKVVHKGKSSSVSHDTGRTQKIIKIAKLGGDRKKLAKTQAAKDHTKRRNVKRKNEENDMPHVIRGKSRLVNPNTGREQGKCKVTKVHRDGKKLDKIGAIKDYTEVQFKNQESDMSLALEDKKRIRRRCMKPDPNDITNKRLDDDTPKLKLGACQRGETLRRKELGKGHHFTYKSIVSAKKEKEETQISMNAQFRAIKPSPEIISYISNNLVGRRRLKELRNAGYNIDISAPLDNVPHSTSRERERIEENVFRSKLEFFAAAKVASSFPQVDMPEIAFAGRSNVGKSSLLNALTRQWGVVRTSDKPGLTQTINFFKLGSKLCLVDLPGYGFAYAKEEVKESWEELVKEYVRTRIGLDRVCLLIDAKWGMKPGDHELINLMERSKTKYQIVLTKTDLVFPIDVARRAMQIQEDLKMNKLMAKRMLMASSKSGAGIRCLRTTLANLTRYVRL